MDIKNEFKTGIKIAADAATDVAQALVEKSRLRAKANRIKQVIKADTELRNQAYIELGRYFYDNLREDSNEDLESLCVVVDKTTTRINKATGKYVELMSDSNDIKFSGENAEKLKKMVAEKADKIKDTSSEKVKDIKEKAKSSSLKAKDKAVDLGNKAKIAAQDLSVKAKETVADFSDKAKDKVEDFKSFIAPDEDVEDIIYSTKDDKTDAPFKKSEDTQVVADPLSLIEDNEFEAPDEIEIEPENEVIRKAIDTVNDTSVNETPIINSSITIDTDDEESPDEFEF